MNAQTSNANPYPKMLAVYIQTYEQTNGNAHMDMSAPNTLLNARKMLGNPLTAQRCPLARYHSASSSALLPSFLSF